MFSITHTPKNLYTSRSLLDLSFSVLADKKDILLDVFREVLILTATRTPPNPNSTLP